LRFLAENGGKHKVIH